MYPCPYCGKQLNTWAAITAGPLAPKTCSHCGNRYFAGGGTGSLALFFSGWATALVFGRHSSKPGVIFVASLTVATVLSIAYGLRKKPQPIERRWRDLLLLSLVTIGFIGAMAAILIWQFG